MYLSRVIGRNRASLLGPLMILPLLVVAVLLVGCGTLSPNGIAKVSITTLNDLQDAAAREYQTATGQEAAAGLRCADAARKAGVALPALKKTATKEEGEAAMRPCAALGEPLPYNPALLRDTGEAVNASYEAIRAADAARRAAVASGSGDTTKTISAAVEALSRLYAAAKELGLNLPFDKLLALKGGSK